MLEYFVEKLFPDVSKLIGDLQASLSMVCMQWFLCLFVEVFPTQTTVRLWDIIMCSGKNVLIQIVLQLVKVHHHKILTFKTSTEFYEFCTSFPSTVLDADGFFKEVLTNFAAVNDNIEGVRKRVKAEVEETLKKMENLRIQKKNSIFNTRD